MHSPEARFWRSSAFPRLLKKLERLGQNQAENLVRESRISSRRRIGPMAHKQLGGFTISGVRAFAPNDRLSLHQARIEQRCRRSVALLGLIPGPWLLLKAGGVATPVSA
jgi:hypothetical protein